MVGLAAGYFVSRSAISDSGVIGLPIRMVDLGVVENYEHIQHFFEDESYFGSDSLLVANLTRVLNDSYEVMKKGLYINEFARYDMRALGASSVVFSNIYHITKDHFQEVTYEGFEAVKGAIALKDLLLEAVDHVEFNQDEYDQFLASVDYEIELFRLLDYYRQFFMHYYRWIDTGDSHSSAAYKLAMGQFKAMMDFHENRYGENLDAMGMDFEETKTGISIAEEIPSSVRWAKVVVVLFLFLMVLGIPGAIRDRANQRFAGTLLFDSIFRPNLISGQNAYHGTRRLAFFLLAIYVLSLVIFSTFTSLLFPLCIGGLGLLFIGMLTLVIGRGRDIAEIGVSLMASKVLIMSAILVVVAIRGPLYFWYLMWTSDIFKMLFFSLFFMLLLRKFQVYSILSRKWNGNGGSATGALPYVMLGFQILVAGVTLWIVGLERSLTALNNEMLLIPAGLSKSVGITTHLGIPLQLPFWMVSFGAGLMGVSLMWYFVARRRSF